MRKRTHKSTEVHSDWLSQVDVHGPFLAYPVVRDMWPNGVDRLGDTDDRLIMFKQAFAQWQRAFDYYVEQPKTAESKNTYDTVRRAWIDVVLNDMAEWEALRTGSDVMVRSPGEQVTVTATGALKGREGDTAALLLVCDPTSGLRDAGLDGWAANDTDRLAMLLRKAQVEVGIVTDGHWWALVWAKEGKPTGCGMVNALTWAEEPLLRDAFFTLINQRRFRASDAEQRLPRLFERSELEAEEITEALGTQVRRSVELLAQAFSEARLEAAKAGDPDPLTEKPDDIYQAAVTVMMRIVFLLFAEERDMLPTEQLYWDSYAMKDLLDDLRTQAAGGEEQLDETYDAWHRLLAVSQALHGGVNYDEMRMPAYGGSLLDPQRFRWLHVTDSRGLRLKVSDRVMLHVLESVQTVVAKGERRRISFREIDVEQIGYIYEGLLGYSCAEVAGDIILGLVGKDGAEPEIPLATINDLYDDSGGDSKKFATALVAWIKDNQPAATGKTVAALARLVDSEPADDDRAELVRLLAPVAAGDRGLLETLVSWGSLIRRDLRNIPLVLPVGGLVVIETPSRKNAGAHYTPRSLAEEVVLHALQPLVYEPGPLESNDESEWRLKPAAAILDLKVADIAVGSGAFLVAAARYLSERLVEAWIAEGMLGESASADPEDLRRRALREVIARCLYGADINPMAVEMCKLSLWLVSMDKTKPFSFVDDKVFCGNSLLGITSLDQLRYLHIHPKPSTMQQQILVDIDAKIATATQLRHELASPVEERDPMRSSRAKTRLLEQLHQATEELRLIADGLIAAGLPLGGKTGRQLDDGFKTLSWHLQQARPSDGSAGDPTPLLERIRSGLTPTVETDYQRWQPLHWVLEAPDVMLEHGGFDAIIGNPPFLVAKKISAAIGSNLREFLVNVVAGGASGKADLAAYFLLRWASLGNDQSTLGGVLPDAIREGATRRVALAQLVDKGSIYRSVRSEEWPTSTVSTRISKVWWSRAGRSAMAFADGRPVDGIDSGLDPAGRVPEQRPLRLVVPYASKGSDFLGDGFLLTPDEGRSLLAEDPVNANVVRPYLNGKAATANLPPRTESYIIDFREMSEWDAQRYVRPWEIARKRVYPERMRKDGTKYPRMVDEWWKHWNSRVELYARLAGKTEVCVVPAVSRHGFPVRVSGDQVLSSALIVFPYEDPAVYAILASSWHRLWLEFWGSSMRGDLRYSIGDIWNTFPMLIDSADLGQAGSALWVAMNAAGRSISGGTTAVMNRVNQSQYDPVAGAVRDQVRLVDEVLAENFGYSGPADYALMNLRGNSRWMPTIYSDMLRLMLELNHERARASLDRVDRDQANRQDKLFS